MAHELEQDEQGRTAMVSGNNVSPWHRLGTLLPEGLTAEQAIEHAFLKDWDLQKATLHTYLEQLTPEGVVTEEVEVPGLYTITRTNPFTKRREILGVEVREETVRLDDGSEVIEKKIVRPAGGVGMRHTVYQNEDGVAFMQEITDTYGEAVFETAGSIRGGTQTFVTMRLKDFKVAGRDGHSMYLVYLFNHLTGANQVFVTHIRVVCANTVDAAQATVRTKFMHTASIDEKHRSQEVRDTLALSFNYNEKFQAEAERLIQVEMDLAQFRNLCDEIWAPLDKEQMRSETNPKGIPESKFKAESARNTQLKQLFLFSDTQEDTRTPGGETTRWTAYNTLVEYLDHYSAVRARSDKARAVRRAENTIDGIPDKEKAYRLITAA